MTVSLSPDVRNITRKTYGLLDWFGDWGGLLDSLFLIAELICYPISANELYTKVASFTRPRKRQKSDRRNTFVKEVINDNNIV